MTNQHLAVADDTRVALHVPYPALRRVQFDIERHRPATLVIVPESPHGEPQALAVQPEDYVEIARVLATASAGVTYWVSHDKATRELGFNPRDLEQGIVDTWGRE